MQKSLRFGAYEIETLLGPGGVTETFRAHRLGVRGKVFALKLLRPDRSGGDSRVAMAFKNLAFRNRQIRVPGIAALVEVSVDPASVFLVSEFVDGMDMEALLDAAAATGALEAERVADIGRQASVILAQLHQRRVPIIHGGLCPGNIIVTASNQVVITDPGYSATLRNLADFAIDKWWFVAPELLVDPAAHPTPLSDVYSLGAVLYYLLCGEPPQMADTRAELLEQAKEDPPPIVTAPDGLAAAIARMLSRDPAARPANMDEVNRILSDGAPSPLSAPAPEDAEEEALPNLDLLDDGVVPPGGIGEHDGPVDLVPNSGPMATDSPGTGGGDGQWAEPKWVDEPGALPGPGGTRVDDFLDLPAQPGGAGVLSAQGSGTPVHLPSFHEMPAISMPRGIDLESTSAARPRSREDEGIHGDTDRLAGPIDMNAVGVVDYVEGDDDGDGPRAGRATGTFTPISLPRRAGSARAGIRKTSGRSPMTVGLGLLLFVMAGLGIHRLMRPPRVVMPPEPPRISVPSPPVDSPEDQEMAARQKAQAAAIAPSVGQLTIDTTPRGAMVWIDGVERGRTPLQVTTKPGGHRIVITKPGFKMLREIADTTEGLTIKRTLPPANINFGGSVTLKVECQTEGKYPVFIDGRDTGLLCPVEELTIPDGNRLVGLYVIPDNKIWSFEREVLPGAQKHRVIFSY